MRFRSSYFVGEEALFILAVLKIILLITSVHAITIIYKRCTDKEFDKRYLNATQKNETHVCLFCKKAFLLDRKEVCQYCGSHAIEPAKGIYKKYPQFEISKDRPRKPKEQGIFKTEPISKEEKLFKLFFIAWSVLWVGGIVHKIAVDNDFIAIFIFAWLFFAIAYLIPYVVKIIINK